MELVQRVVRAADEALGEVVGEFGGRGVGFSRRNACNSATLPDRLAWRQHFHVVRERVCGHDPSRFASCGLEVLEVAACPRGLPAARGNGLVDAESLRQLCDREPVVVMLRDDRLHRLADDGRHGRLDTL